MWTSYNSDRIALKGSSPKKRWLPLLLLNIMVVYWEDIIDNLQSWCGLKLSVQPNNSWKPWVRLETGPNRIIKLLNSQQTMFWARIASDYGGVSVLKTLEKSSLDTMLIPPIKSQDMERFKTSKYEHPLQFWSRFFAQRLAESPLSFLYQGPWLMTGFAQTDQNKPWEFSESTHNTHQFGQGTLEAIAHCLDPDPIVWIDWWSLNPSVINLKYPDPDSGRVKWWRKKVRENCLPPILLWYLDCLSAYIIVDGHSRLLAALIENKEPKFLALYSIQEVPSNHDKAQQNRIVRGLEQQLSISNKDISVDTLNFVLIRAFENRPYWQTKTIAWARIRSERIWIAEVEQYLSQVGRVNEIEFFKQN